MTARLIGELRRPGVRHLRHGTRTGGNLTSRETDVLELILDGLSTMEIGQRLFLAPPTVRSHVAAVMRKTGVRDRDALRALFDGSHRVREDDRP